MSTSELRTPFTRLMSKDGAIQDSGRYPLYAIGDARGRPYWQYHTPRGGVAPEKQAAADEHYETSRRSFSSTRPGLVHNTTNARTIWHLSCMPSGRWLSHPHQTCGGTSRRQRRGALTQHLEPRAATVPDAANQTAAGRIVAIEPWASGFAQGQRLEPANRG